MSFPRKFSDNFYNAY